MKRSKLTILSAIVAITGSLGMSTITYGADNANTTANATVTPGALSIKSSDNISFDPYQIDGKGKNDYKEKNVSKVNIEDFRGSSDVGWVLHVKMDEGFSKEQTGTESGIVLKFKPTINSNQESATIGSENIAVNTMNSIVASVANEKIKNSEFETNIALGASLDIPAKVKAKSYTTKLIWNLAVTPEK